MPASKPKLTRRMMRRARWGSVVVTSPPSPIAKGFVAWNENTSASPWRPRGSPRSSVAPNPAAESTSSGTPARAAARRHPMRSAIGGGVPKVEAASTATTVSGRPSSAASRAAGSRCHERGSTSTNTGSRPAQRTALTAAANVNEGISTSRRRGAGTGHRAERDHQPQRGVGDRDARDAWADIAPEPLDEQLMTGTAVRVPAGLLGQREVRLDLTRRWDLRGLKADHRPCHSNPG